MIAWWWLIVAFVAGFITLPLMWFMYTSAILRALDNVLPKEPDASEDK